MVDFFIFRHGETDWNRLTKFQGHSDIPLNETGHHQAQVLAGMLEPLKPQVMLTSDLIRAKETAAAANKNLKLQVFEAPELRETNLGEAEGLERDKVRSTFGEDSWAKWQSYHEDEIHFGFPKGETKFQHRQRLLHCLESFADSHPDQTRVAVSTHGGSLFRLIGNCVNKPAGPFSIHNCSLYHLQFDPNKRLWTYVRQVE